MDEYTLNQLNYQLDIDRRLRAEQSEIEHRRLNDIIEHDRRERAALVEQLEQAADLVALALFTQVETLGPTGTTTALANKLEERLQKRGVL